MRHWPPASADLPPFPTVRPSGPCPGPRARLSILLPVAETDLADLSAEGRRTIVRRLERALRAERRRGRAGHWTYDLNRHLALKRALEAERAALARLTG